MTKMATKKRELKSISKNLVWRNTTVRGAGSV